jgi:hypothetical protein
VYGRTLLKIFRLTYRQVRCTWFSRGIVWWPQNSNTRNIRQFRSLISLNFEGGIQNTRFRVSEFPTSLQCHTVLDHSCAHTWRDTRSVLISSHPHFGRNGLSVWDRHLRISVHSSPLLPPHNQTFAKGGVHVYNIRFWGYVLLPCIYSYIWRLGWPCQEDKCQPYIFYVTYYRNMQSRETETRYSYNFCIVKQSKPVLMRVRGGCICWLMMEML